MVVLPTVLDAAVAPQVQYCIPLWLRDQQILAALARVPGRIEPIARRPKGQDTVAVVCFGPSLEQTWRQVQKHRYVISCSGSHKFLVEHGITPTWHVEVDPREHKVGLIGPPQKETTYLIASTCHPKVFDHLAGHDVKLWHVFDNSEEGKRLLPPGEWAVTGGCDVGLRALTLAGFLGFRQLHVYGMDHSAGTVDAPTDRRHAAAHPNGGSKFQRCAVGGVEYLTTASMLAAAQTVWHELDQMPTVKARFYGRGLCQAMSKTYVPRAVPPNDQRDFSQVVAIRKPLLITPAFRDLNAQLHRDNLTYGVGGAKHAPVVQKLAVSLKTTSVLDYGAGKGLLAQALPYPIWEYDPAIPTKAAPPRPADLVVCTDVLEHIEPDCLVAVLDDLRRCVRRLGYFVIDMAAAQKCYADGRNTHLLQHDEAWWRSALDPFFQVGQCWTVGGRQLHVVVGARPRVALTSAQRLVASLNQTVAEVHA